MNFLPKPKLIVLYLLLGIFTLVVPGLVFAQYRLPTGSFSATVSGKLGDFYLDIAGYITPFASIVISSDGVYLRSTVSNQTGYFTISQILVKKGFSHFCFDAVDFKRIGESYSCTKITPVEGPTSIKDIFLPPTLGLSRSEIAAGSSTTAWGYSMPGALVTLFVSGKTYTTYADSSGYYQVTLKDVKAGTYELYAKARLNGVDSLEPEYKLKLKALSWWEQFLEWLINLWKKFVGFMTSLSLGPLWIAIPIIILIIILILKLWPERFTFIFHNRIFIFFSKAFKRHKKLHHSYFMGY